MQDLWSCVGACLHRSLIMNREGVCEFRKAKKAEETWKKNIKDKKKTAAFIVFNIAFHFTTKKFFLVIVFGIYYIYYNSDM